MTRDTSITPPSISVNHPNHEGTVFSVFMLRTDRTSGHYHLDEMVNYFCHMSSVRGTSDGRGPVTRTRVPDRDEQGKPSEDARRGRCHPLEAGIYPCGCHRYRDTQLPSTKYQAQAQLAGGSRAPRPKPPVHSHGHGVGAPSGHRHDLAALKHLCTSSVGTSLSCSSLWPSWP